MPHYLLEPQRLLSLSDASSPNSCTGPAKRCALGSITLPGDVGHVCGLRDSDWPHSYRSIAGKPSQPYPLNFLYELRTFDLETSALRPSRIMFIRHIERIPQKSNISRLQRLERLATTQISNRPHLRKEIKTYRHQVTPPQSQPSDPPSFRIRRCAPFHVDNNHEFDSRVGQPAVHGVAFVQGVEQAKVMPDGFRGHAGFEDVQRRVEHEAVF